MFGLKKLLWFGLIGIVVLSVLVVTAQQAPAGQGGQRAGQGAQGGQGGRGGQGGARGQRAGAGGAPAAEAGPTGLTVTGEVPNFVPVTDAMLRKPDPGDWLMIRRDYFASDYSPLDQINRDNVKDLKLVWMSPMHEGGTNQPAPIVHNGVIYLANTGGIMQAIDGLTWKSHLGEPPRREHRDARHLASIKTSSISRAAIASSPSMPGKATKSGIRKSLRATATRAVLSSSTARVLEGLGGCQRYQEEKCFMSAYDAQTGKQLWRFYTIATTGNKGAETWGNLPDKNRAGGEMWITGSYDPALNLTYLGNRSGQALDDAHSRHGRRWPLRQFDDCDQSG